MRSGAPQPDVVVVSGWSTFASQAAIAWCARARVPYVLLVESHDLGPRAGWRRAVKGAVVPRIVRGAASVLVVGTRRARVGRRARREPERVRVFANTIDVDAWASARRELLRTRRAAGGCGFGRRRRRSRVARLVPEKGLDTLVRAVADDRRRAASRSSSPAAVPSAERLTELAAELGVQLTIAR